MFANRLWQFIVRYRLALIGGIMLVVTTNINWGGDHWKSVLAVDARGYYAHLPSLLLYGDIHFEMEDTITVDWYQDPARKFEYRHDALDVRHNKYHVGTSVLQLPFFGGAHLIAWLTGQRTNGYSRPYILSITLAAWFYLLLGIYFLGRWLKEARFSPTVATLVILAIVFGTNLFYYVIREPGMSHVYSFAFVALFCWTGWRYFRDGETKWLFWFSIAFGMIILIRPVNALVLLSLPFLAGSWKQLKQGILIKLGKPKKLVAAALPAIAIFSIQLILYKIQTGQFWVYSYGEEKLHLDNPHLWEFLVSYKKGAFVYVPILFISLIGFGWWWRHSRVRAMSLLVFLLIVVYILSSWWNWWYGGSFGQRPLIEFYPFFALLLAGLLTWVSGKISQPVVVSVLFALTMVCQIQTYQYRYGMIHWEDMDKHRYWQEFLRIDKFIRY